MNKSKEWSEMNIKPMATFRTVSEFWGMYQNCKRPAQIPNGTVINVFIEGIKPVWEVPELKKVDAGILGLIRDMQTRFGRTCFLALLGSSLIAAMKSREWCYPSLKNRIRLVFG